MELAYPFIGMRAYRQGGIAAKFMKPHTHTHSHTDCVGHAASYLYK